MPARSKASQLFTVENFESYASRLILDTGDFWQLEDFQAEIVDSILTPIRHRMLGSGTGGNEIWAILPEGQAKTTLMAGLGLYLADFSPLPWIPVGASTRDQAEILAQQAYQMVRASPGMLKRFRIYEGYRRIQPIRPDHPAPGRRGLKVISADVSTGDGVIPFPLAILDEGHRHPDMRLYRLWVGKLQKRGGVIVMISTAGEPGHDFETLRDEIRTQATESERNGAHLVSRSKNDKVVMHEWRVQKVSDVSDMKKVKEANPLSAITVEELQKQFESPTLDLGSWTRLKCNLASRDSTAAVSDQEWDDAFMKLALPDGSSVDLGVDVAWKHDTFAIVPLWKGPDYRLLGEPQILKPPSDGSMLHPDTVKIAFETFLNRYKVGDIVMDMQRAEDIAVWLEDEHSVRVFDWAVGNAQAAKDYERFMEALRSRELRHNGSAALRAHVMNAVARALPGDKRRFDRPSQARTKAKQDHRVIDALMAAAMVNSYAAEPRNVMNIDDYRIEGL